MEEKEKTAPPHHQCPNKTTHTKNSQSAFSNSNPDLWLPRPDFINVHFLFDTLISLLVLSSSIKFLNAFALLQVICQCLINNFSSESVCLFLNKTFSSNYLDDLWESMLFFFSWSGVLGGSQQGSENYSKHTDALGLKVEHSFVKKFSKNNLDFSISPLFPN